MKSWKTVGKGANARPSDWTDKILSSLTKPMEPEEQSSTPVSRQTFFLNFQGRGTLSQLSSVKTLTVEFPNSLNHNCDYFVVEGK